MERVWFHVTWSTYGQWLPGHPRGFRSRGDRIKSCGYDPCSRDGHGEHAGLHGSARGLLRKDPVELTGAQQRAALRAILEKVRQTGSEVVCLAVCDVHVHLLGRFEREGVEREIGRLKRHSSHALRAEIPGAVWGARRHPVEVRDRDHQVNAFKDILDHAGKAGAAVWSFRDGWPRPEAVR